MSEAAAADPALDPQDPDGVITDFVERVPDIVRAAVVTSDGVLVAVSNRREHGEPEQLSAVTAGLTSLAGAAAGLFDYGTVTQSLVTMARGTLVIMAIDGGSSLAVLASAAADLDMVAYEMTMLVDEAGSVFSPPAR